jgi:ABC-2 type transport system ATP-binding protein/lipopolysaccharide transport system ATP-binding protein
MVEENMIEINNVSMIYNMSNDKIDSIKEYLIKLYKKQLFFKEFIALRDVSLTIKKGEVFGIVGLNGAGKSTLLKIIAGVLKPSSGSVVVKGSMAPLIELGAGFNYNLTGRENIFLNGAVLGYSNAFMKEKFDEIVEFSELHQFIDVQLKNYSSGMVARLAFAIATLTNPDILIVDEVLSVGDYKFQEKSQKKMFDLLEGDTTVIFVSHSPQQVKQLCDRVMWLEKGRVKMIGPTDEVVDAYLNGENNG